MYADDDIERIIFEERQIEGKIRRPQLVLIKAEQRPGFEPMVMQSLSDFNIIEFSKGSVIEKSPYDKAFTLEGDKITNYVQWSFYIKVSNEEKNIIHYIK